MRKQKNARWKKHCRQAAVRCLLVSVTMTPLLGELKGEITYGASAAVQETAAVQESAVSQEAAAGQESAVSQESAANQGNAEGQIVEISTAEEL